MQEIQAQEQFEREKQAYFAMRDELLKTHFGKWVAIVEGKVAAVGDSAVSVIQEVLAKKGATVMYVKRVGFEERVLRIRQVSVGWYDEDYDPPIPKVDAEISSPLQLSQTVRTDFVIDTGADLTLVKQDVALQISLYRLPVGEERISGIGGIPEFRQLYLALIDIGGRQLPIRTDLRDDIDENILGRDVLNWFRLTLSAQENLVRVEAV
ncbi:MAG: retroviral-like aspartic protease family protein [Armatimonadota bacterium]|nr:retroviral-like aspartic protease family protein [Armatimonadota bacterium]